MTGLTELEALNWLKARGMWTIVREGTTWTLTMWVGGPTRDSAVMRVYPVIESTGPGVAFIGLVALAKLDEETRR